MTQLKSLSDKRLIIVAKMNGRDANLLLDTGASVGIMADSSEKKLRLIRGKKFGKPLTGAGGDMDAYHCHTFAYVDGRPVTQFLIADIDNVVDSIKRETGVTIDGIMALPQMKMAGITINTSDGIIRID